ncbi:hypothetical protein COB52_00070 [Candidatus Kaiserbacteria bacterium]|nr:MAG: hypothetical protein COB52_00070 [Candidatus Kaiserbacteria bacterium]
MAIAIIGGVALNETVDGTTVTLTNFTISAAVGNYLVVAVSTECAAANTGPCTGVTYGGVALTELANEVCYDSSFGAAASWWILANPTTGSANVVATYQNTQTEQHIYAMEITGAPAGGATASLTSTLNDPNSTAGQITHLTDIATDGTLILLCVADGSKFSRPYESYETNQTELYWSGGASHTMAITYQTLNVGDTQPTSFETDNYRYASAVIGFEPAGGAPAGWGNKIIGQSTGNINGIDRAGIAKVNGV